MSKITSSFMVLVLVIVFSSIGYIWKAEAERKELENKISSQQQQIASLESKLTQKEMLKNKIDNSEVKGVSTDTGLINGSVIIQNTLNPEAIVVCANKVDTNQEVCTDSIVKNNQKVYKFELELPTGNYEIYTLTPPIETRTYYLRQCKNEPDCLNNKEKGLIKVIPEENQTNIDIYL